MNILIAGAVSFVMLLAAEGMIRKTGLYRTYFERAGLDRETPHLVEKQVEPWLWVDHPSHTSIRNGAEFTEAEYDNALGIPAPEYPSKKEPNEFRIIALGDSFTQGVGARTDPDYPRALEESLRGRLKNNLFPRVLSAGVGGSDPVFELELLRRKLLPFRPDLVVLAMNFTDVGELIRRGGLDRFGQDGFLKTRELPWFTGLFDRFHTVRGLFIGALGYDWELYSPKEHRERGIQAREDLVRVAEMFHRLGGEKGFKTLVVIHPMWQELAQRGLHPELNEVEAAMRERRVDFADLLDPMLNALPSRTLTKEYYWPLDGHYKSKGYKVMASAVLSALERRSLLPLK